MAELIGMDCGCGYWNNRSVNRIYEHLAESGAPLAMGYIPYQKWENTYEPCKGLRNGTIFPSLYKPFCGKGGRN